MKNIHLCFYTILSLIILCTSCGLDNYDEPKSTLMGKIVHNGEPLQLRGTDERVRIQLYQDGYAFKNPIDLFLSQEGAFSALLFDGEYKMVTRANNGPWVDSRDTVRFQVKGSTKLDFEVTPFFTITNADITLSDDVMSATFTINQIAENAEIDRIFLLVNNTNFVDDEFNLQRADFTHDLSTGTVKYSMNLEDKAKNARTLKGRICVWTKNADQGIYSQVVSLK